MVKKHEKQQEYRNDTGADKEVDDIPVSKPADSIAVNTDTGEIAATERPMDQQVDIVHMPKKIVAKDIVGRAALKCTKKWKPTLDKHGEPATDGDGNPVGEWELSEPRTLYTVFGTASGTRGGTSNYGDWVAFKGTFEAVRSSDGARFLSNELILQQPAESLLIDALATAKKNDEGASVKFAFEVGVKTSQRWVDTNEGNSYEYTIKSMLSVNRHDPLAEMRKALSGVLPKTQQKMISSDQG